MTVCIDLDYVLIEMIRSLRKRGDHGPCDGTCSSCEEWRETAARLGSRLVTEVLQCSLS